MSTRETIEHYQQTIALLESAHLISMTTNLALALEQLTQTEDDPLTFTRLLGEVKANLESSQAEIMGIVRLIQDRVDYLRS
jgi:hypothetical protein